MPGVFKVSSNWDGAEKEAEYKKLQILAAINRDRLEVTRGNKNLAGLEGHDFGRP